MASRRTGCEQGGGIGLELEPLRLSKTSRWDVPAKRLEQQDGGALRVKRFRLQQIANLFALFGPARRW